jgi:periplasmic protein TonB
MAKQTSCVKCGRGIDEFARACPYCNWWQSQPVPAQAAPPPAVDYTPPPDNRARNSIIGVLTVGFLMMLAFTVGAFFHGSDEAKAAQAQTTEQPAQTQRSPRATVTLVPMTDGAPPPVIDSPITSVTPNGTTTAGGPSDATAMPSDQYAAAAARMKASQQQAGGNVVDPRSITGSAYSAPPRPAARPRQMAVQTQPVATFQPVPHVRVDREVTAQLYLTVGTDGRVRDIDIQRAAPNVIGPLVGAVQQWRFRPATQNGEPVTSRFTVAVTFKP